MYQRWYNRQVEVAFELSLERERREHAKTKELLQRTRASLLAYQDAERAAREYNRKDQARATRAQASTLAQSTCCWTACPGHSKG